MKLKRRHFILLESIFLLLGVCLLGFVFMNYENSSITLGNMSKKEISLKKDQSFDLPNAAKKVYEKIFISSYDSNNIVPYLQKKIVNLSLNRDVSILDVKIKKIENNVFSFVVKMTSKDDRALYLFVSDIENLNDVFIFSKNLTLQKRSKIGGEYHFEAYTKP